MSGTNVACPRLHFEPHHVALFASLRRRCEQLQVELDNCGHRLAFVAEQLDALRAEAERVS